VSLRREETNEDLIASFVRSMEFEPGGFTLLSRGVDLTAVVDCSCLVVVVEWSHTHTATAPQPTARAFALALPV